MNESVTLSDGSEVSLPLLTDDALVCFAGFMAKAGSLPVPPGPLSALSLAGRTPCVLMVADYRSMSIGPYREMVVMSPVRYLGKGGPPISRGVFVHEIAVTSEISMLTGREVWGFPKYLADIRLDDSSGGIKAEMRSERSAFELSLPGRGLPLPASAPLPVFTVKDGRLLLSYIRMKGVLYLSVPMTARLELKSDTSSLAFLGGSARAGISGFMRVTKAALAGAVFEEKL